MRSLYTLFRPTTSASPTTKAKTTSPQKTPTEWTKNSPKTFIHQKSLFFKPTTPAKTPIVAPSPNEPPSPNPSETHFISLIHSSKTISQLHQIHAQVLCRDLSSSSFIATQLISAAFFFKCFNYSLSVFHYYNPKNLFLYNALIRGFAKYCWFEDAVSYFRLMVRSGIKPNTLTYPFVLNSVAALCLDGVGGALHGMILKSGCELDLFVRISLVDMYVKVEELGCASKVFDESPVRFNKESTLLWNVLINGYCKAGKMRRAVELFVTMPERNIVSWNSLIDGFLRKGNLKRAMLFFDHMPEKNVISWTMMINGYSQNGVQEKALSMFTRMLKEGVRPNVITIVSALSACAKVGALETGLWIQNYLRDNGFQLTRTIRTALVDMYAKCGNIEIASQAFQEMKERDIFTWSVMIWGWAIHGHFEQAIQCFKQMLRAGIKPDEVVFLGILTACAHSGQVKLGLNFFNSMELDYSIEPTLKHYALVVYLLGRGGQLNQALKFIQSMPIIPDFVIWESFILACRAHKNIKMLELASQKLMQYVPKHPRSYIFLSNVYAAVGKQENVEGVRVLMQKRGVDKDPGWSYIEVDGKVHSFVAGDHAHVKSKEIYLKLEEIVEGAREQGYMQEGTEWELQSIEEEEKEDASGSHSEKLALAFGLIHTPPGKTIRIVKSLRVCGDCHSFMKCASKISQREIVLRDVKRFHHFKDGTCSCGDYW